MSCARAVPRRLLCSVTLSVFHLDRVEPRWRIILMQLQRIKVRCGTLHSREHELNLILKLRCFKAFRGRCLCYSGRFICMRPPPGEYKVKAS